MKSPLHHVLRAGLVCAAAILISGQAVRADDDDATTTTRIKFSDPAKPGTLNASLPWADVQITGTNGDEIVVTSTLAQKGKKEDRPDGLRRLDDEVSFELLEKNNTATLRVSGDNAWSAHGAEFKVQVPHNTSLVLRTEAGGDMKIENIDGDIDISSVNGEVVLNDIGSSAVVNTMNGEIRASFKAAPVKAVSLSSMNGEISVRIPGDSKANVRMRSHNGAILTDFPETALKTRAENSVRHGEAAEAPEAPEQPEAPESADAPHARSPDAPPSAEIARAAERAARDAQRQAQRAVQQAQRAMMSDQMIIPGIRIPHFAIPAFGGKSVVGTLNGGGVDIQLSTMNGSITLRQNK
jgi:hypothetical protein